jgi:hypothetical protein
MRISSIVMVAVCSVTLAGCQTLSFAPPNVNLSHEVEATGLSGCTITRTQDSIGPDVLGALQLTNNFIVTYRCASREAADGRQFFEVPSFLAIAAAALGPSFGLNEDERLGLGAGAAIFNAGKAYYAPKEKAGILDSAIDALLCIKTESVGVSFFDTREATQDAQANDTRIRSPLVVAGSGGIQIDVDRQYFEMVSASLFSVERILAQRLSNVGTYDAEGIVAQIEKLQAERKTREDAANAGRATQANNLLSTDSAVKSRAQSEVIRLEVAALQPKLQTCVVRAKL